MTETAEKQKRTVDPEYKRIRNLTNLVKAMQALDEDDFEYLHKRVNTEWTLRANDKIREIVEADPASGTEPSLD
jgi:hypothetical protein